LTAAAVRQVCRGRRVAFAWSGGKDSLALQVIMRAAGIEECVFGMTRGLEYPAFLAWVTDHMPDGLEVIDNGWDMGWLARHPGMLFPRSADVAAKWFKGVQHVAQEKFYRSRGLDVLILGRRRDDGNFVGRGVPIYAAGGITRYSPLADWTQADVLTCLRCEGWTLDGMPPFYSWPRGFRCGTHPWPARQWCRDEQHGWEEVYKIDPTLVMTAAAVMPGAASFLSGMTG
jgi:3'-phosphoadenosine 5'-phosphosulfate sulfotransferase (PAPS reductase)/FAD synthetase